MIGAVRANGVAGKPRLLQKRRLDPGLTWKEVARVIGKSLLAFKPHM
jgi:hypothetical protein